MTLRLAHGRLECHVDPFDLDTALTKLAALDARKSRIADPRFFAGLSLEEASHVLQV